MKKVISVIFAALLLGSAVAVAQPRALGIRGGYGAELSYQHYVGGDNFVEGDLGLWGNGFYVSGIYDFVFAKSGIVNFYAGPGAQIGFYGYTNDEGNRATGFNAGIAGQIGAEFEIPTIPLNISIDWKPVFYFTNGNGFGWNGFALGLRYRF